MNGAKKNDHRKQIIRLIKLLLAVAPDHSTLNIKENVCHLEVGGKELQFDKDVVTHCIERGLLRKVRNSISATAEAKSALRRLLSEVPDFQSQHGVASINAVSELPAVDAVHFNRSESPLARLQFRSSKSGAKFLESWEYEAGERLRIDFEKAGLTPSISARCEGTITSNQSACFNTRDEFNNIAIDAKRRFHCAADFVGPELSGVVVDVCCFLKGLELVERERQWPARSAKMLLKAGLSKLARHYGLIAVPRANDRGPVLHWGTMDFRPSIR